MRRKLVEKWGYRVEIVGHSASGIRGIDPENPKLKMGELVSAPALKRYCDDIDIVKSLFTWLREGLENPQIELVLNRMGKNLGRVIKKLLGWNYWKGVERIYVGGGLSEGRSGDIIVDSANEFLRENSNQSLDLRKINYHPAVVALIGITYFIPVENRNVVTVDLGGGNLRTGIVNPPEGNRMVEVYYSRFIHWQELGLEREGLADLIASEIASCLNRSEKLDVDISEYIGIGVPAAAEDGRITGKDRNLPGDWSDPEFRLSEIINEKIRKETNFNDFKYVIKNDAVSQGLSEIPFAGDVKDWGILTIGTGLGNARFRNLDSPNEQ